MSYEQIDGFLRDVATFLKFLKSESVPDPAQFRLQQMIDSWAKVENRWILIRENMDPYEIAFYAFSKIADLHEKMVADEKWVKSQITNPTSPASAKPASSAPRKRSGRGRKKDPERQKSVQEIRKVVKKHGEAVLKGEITTTQIAEELITLKKHCWHPGDWKEPTVITVINEEMNRFRDSRN